MNFYEIDIDSVLKELNTGRLPDDVIKGLDLVFDALERKPSGWEMLLNLMKGRVAMTNEQKLLGHCKALLAYIESSNVGGRSVAQLDCDNEQVPEIRNARAAIAEIELRSSGKRLLNASKAVLHRFDMEKKASGISTRHHPEVTALYEELDAAINEAKDKIV